MKKQIDIAGAGLVGSLLSIYLKRHGYDVTIFERRPDMRVEKISAGRSINLALSDRGILPLIETGLMDEIKEICIPMHGRYIHNADGTTAYQPYGKDGQYINAASRGDLNKKLMTLAEKEGVKIVFNQKCRRVDWDKKEMILEHTRDFSNYTHQFDLLFGADGAYSHTRLAHQLVHNRFQYQQFYIDYGYKELYIPADAQGNYQMEKNALHIWPRGNYMLIALPNMDGSFTCTLFFPFEGNPSFESLKTDADVDQFFTETFADARKMMPTLLDDFKHNPTTSLVTVKCKPWIREDMFALIGDAAHAIVPFFGQGMNCGFEDCRILNNLIIKHNHNWQQILQEYEDLRKPDGDAIADLAIENFVEMRDKVGDAVFLLQKKIEKKFSERYPEKWIPAYSMVTFSPHIRYSEALEKGRQQQLIMDKIMAIENIHTKWDDECIMEQMLSLLPPTLHA